MNQSMGNSQNPLYSLSGPAQHQHDCVAAHPPTHTAADRLYQIAALTAGFFLLATLL
jgi:hypothetical protein